MEVFDSGLSPYVTIRMQPAFPPHFIVTIRMKPLHLLNCIRMVTKLATDKMAGQNTLTIMVLQ